MMKFEVVNYIFGIRIEHDVHLVDAWESIELFWWKFQFVFLIFDYFSTFSLIAKYVEFFPSLVQVCSSFSLK